MTGDGRRRGHLLVMTSTFWYLWIVWPTILRTYVIHDSSVFIDILVNDSIIQLITPTAFSDYSTPRGSAQVGA